MTNIHATTESESKTETESESKTETESESKTETETETEIESKTEIESESKTETESESKTETETETETNAVNFLGWKEENPDADGLYDGMVLPHTHYRFLYKTSWLFLASAAYAYQMGHYDYVILPFGVWVTSINYWRKPDYSWRRYVDMFYAHFAVIYQGLSAYGAEYQIPFYVLWGLAVSSYLFAMYFKYKGNGNGIRWNSTLWHGNSHFLAFLCALVLYSGDMPGIYDPVFRVWDVIV
jgi:hypothetical protein